VNWSQSGIIFSEKWLPTVSNGRINLPQEYLTAKKKAKKSNATIPEPDCLDWAYVVQALNYNN